MSPCMAPIESPGRAQRTALAILAVTAIGLYLPALPGPLLLDDRYIIQPLLDAVTHGDSLWLYLFSESGPFGRPLAMASFILNATFAGPDLRYWKATSLAIHLLNGGLVYLTTSPWRCSPPRRRGRRGRWVWPLLHCGYCTRCMSAR